MEMKVRNGIGQLLSSQNWSEMNEEQFVEHFFSEN